MLQNRPFLNVSLEGLVTTGIISKVTWLPGAVFSSCAASATVSCSSLVPSIAATTSPSNKAPHLFGKKIIRLTSMHSHYLKALTILFW